MKKFFLFKILILGLNFSVNAETSRIISGDKKAKITIIAYESLTCSHCADFHKNIYPQLKKEFIDTGIVKLEFRHFPLGAVAFNAAKVSQCEEDKSLKILEILYSNQQEWVKGNSIDEANNFLEKYLRKNNFNIDIEKCIADKEIEDFVLNDRIEGTKKFNVNATPTIIINNKKFDKSLNYKNLKKYLEKML